MKKSEFKNYLDKNNIKYHLEGDAFVITHRGDLRFDITCLPNNIDFRTDGYVAIYAKNLPENIRFNNNGEVSLPFLENLPENIEFNNSDSVYLDAIKSFPKNIKFKNSGHVLLYSIKSLPDNKYEIFKNDGIVYYNRDKEEFDPKKTKEYPIFRQTKGEKNGKRKNRCPNTHGQIDWIA